jgi:uncharacterized protein (TIGR03000 family)
VINIWGKPGRIALTLGVALLVGGTVQAQTSDYPYRGTAPESYRGSNVRTPAPTISPGTISGAAQGSTNPAAGGRTSSDNLGAGVRRGETPLPSFLTDDPYFPKLDNTARTGPDNTAHIWLRVPADAEIWVDGVRTRQTGEKRYFYSPPLKPGEKYSYNIRVVTKKDGKPIEQNRRIPVHAGANVRLDFTQAPAERDEKTPDRAAAR